ncbi:MAG: hypothetical protein GTO14_09040 [Anaerolineales bacterium]|nr:hypothetical protein [Anaerolineales bacterium]
MFPILQLGPLAVQLPGLFLLVGVWISIWLIDRVAPKHEVSAGTLSNMVFLGLVAGILSARLWYALRYLDVYLGAPLSLLSLNLSTLAPLEGALTGLFVAWIYGQRKGLGLWPTLDALTPSFAVMSVAIGFANLASGDAFGAASEVPWSIELWGARRHPSQIYEILLGVVVFFAVWRIKRVKLPPGILFFAWIAVAAASHIFLEAFRGDSIIIFGAFRAAQILGLLVLLGSMWGLHNLSTRNVSSAQEGS